MIKYCVGFILFLLAVSCSNRKGNDNCDKLKNGRFAYHGHFTNTDYAVERNDSLQVEKDEQNKQIFKKRIKWLNSCEYELTFESGQSTDTFPDGHIRMYEPKNKNPMKVKVIKVEKEYYIFETVDTRGRDYRDTMWIIGLVGGFKPIGEVFPAK